MNYYVLEIAEGDSKIAGKGVFTFETEKAAVASFHSKLGTAMKSALYTSELIRVLDSDRKVIKREKYVT